MAVTKKQHRSCPSRLARAAVFAGAVYLTVIAALVTFPTLQPPLVYINWIRYPWGVGWTGPDGGAGYLGFAHDTVRTVRIGTSDNVTLGAWHILPRVPAAVAFGRTAGQEQDGGDDAAARNARFDRQLADADRVYLYFHGNAGNRAHAHRVDFYKMLQRISPRTHVVAIDYRGFGDSDRVSPTEAGVQRDAVAAWEWITARGVQPGKVVVVGHSLGTGVASWLASHLSARNTTGAGLLLLAGYVSMADAALGYPMLPLLWPFKHHPLLAEKARSLVAERWNSEVALAGATDWPILLLHGAKDFEIPSWHARRLFRAVVGARVGRKLGVDAFTVDGELSDFSVTKFAGNEAALYRSKEHAPAWFLEVDQAGHNTLADFEIVETVIAAWQGIMNASS
ncbi:hypothetical protein HDU86_002886 [Geranomyces michiganensis]|nr:hypothetical protein HDU86_002886 [Geranomyces michiganensis]